MKKNCLIIFFLCVCGFEVFAENVPTFVYGSAKTQDGGQDVFVVQQQDNLVNPLGNPIVEPYKPVEDFGDAYDQNVDNSQANSNTLENTNSQKNLGSEFENTLLEANDRVYDIQSYPKADFKAMENPANPITIYSPNVNN